MVRPLARRSLAAGAGIAALLAIAILPICNPAAAGTSAAARASRQPVPILMYHAIRTAPPGARLPALWVRPKDFADEVRALRRAGYTAVSLQRVWYAWHGDASLPRRPVVFSFDDGYESHVRVALPVLRRAGWAGVLNLALGSIDELGGDRAVRRLIDAGWQIDAHSRTHPDLTQVSAAQLADETAGARAELHERFGVDANFFAYPGGRYDARVAAAVRQAGYLGATTVRRAFATPAAPYTLARIQVSRGTSGAALLRRLRALRQRSAAAGR